MSNRETILEINLQQWRGIDQRSSPTLVQDGFFTMARGMYFGLGDNAERLPGKLLSGHLSLAALQIYQFGENTLIQGLGRLWILDTLSLIDRNVVPANIPFDRITEAGDARITENSVIRETD